MRRRESGVERDATHDQKVSSSLDLERHSLDEDISIRRDDRNVLELDLVGLDDLSSSLEDWFRVQSSEQVEIAKSPVSFVSRLQKE